MKIARLECEQFLGVPNGAYSFLAANRLVPNELTVVAGMRGSGKTRLLDAIVALKELVGAYRAPPPLSDLLAVGARAGKLQGTFLLSDEEKDVAQLASNDLTVEVGFGEAVPEMSKVSVAVRKLFSRYDHDPSRGKLEYFPSSRTLPPFGEPTTVTQEKLLRLSPSPAKYAGLIPSLLEMSTADGALALREASTRGLLLADDAPDSLGRYRAAFATLLPELRLRGARPGEAGRSSLSFERPNGSMLDAHQLSESQKQSVLIAGTMLRIGLARSIVLLDEPELHIHVADQAKLMESLLALGSDNQWIVATGSSEIMKSVRRDQMIVLPSANDTGVRRGA